MEIYPSNIEYVVVKDVVNLSLKILHGNHWNASWLALGGSINPSRFYQLIANHSSSNWKPIMMQSHSVYFKRVKDFFKSVLKGKERTFRKANGKFLMTNFQFNNELTTQTFEMHWNSIENWIKQNLRK